jgi:Tfp pilus assembly protein FimT
MKWRTAGKSRKSATARSGLTLLELLLVLGIIVTLAAMVLPAFDRIFASQRLDKSADLVRAEMGRARVQAIRTGKVFAFVYNEGQSQLAVRQFDQLAQAGSIPHFERASGSPQGGMADGRAGNMDYSNEELPRGVRFVTGQAIDDIRSQYESASAGGSKGKLKPILFYPDGSSQDAQIVLANERGDVMRVIVRGLTGSARAVRVSQ